MNLYIPNISVLLSTLEGSIGDQQETEALMWSLYAGTNCMSSLCFLAFTTSCRISS